MTNQLLTIADASNLVNKSAQTIRRLIKNGKVKYRRKSTAQGFNYMIDKASLLDECGLTSQVDQATAEEPQQQAEKPPIQQESRQQQPIQDQSTYKVGTEPEIYVLGDQEEENHDPSPVMESYVEQAEDSQQQAQKPDPTSHPTSQPTNQMDSQIVSKLLDQHREDKEKLYQLLEIFQNRVVSLEEQVKQLQAPPKKKWWRLW